MHTDGGCKVGGDGIVEGESVVRGGYPSSEVVVSVRRSVEGGFESVGNGGAGG